MDKLKRNAFWFGLAVVGGLIVVAFAVLVLPAWQARQKAINDLTKLNNEIKAIKDKGDAVPSDKQVEALKLRKEELQKDLETCKKWYKGYDDEFETWFAGLPPNPAVGAFNAKYDTSREELEKKLKDAGINIGIRGVEEAIIPGGATPQAGGIRWPVVGGPAGLTVLDVQKRFWVGQRVAAALLQIQTDTQRKGVAALEEILFAPDKTKLGEEYPGWPATPYELPGKYGAVITAGIRAEISNAQVPKFLKLLLESDDPAPKLLTHIRGVRVTLTEALQEKYEDEVKVPEGQPIDAPKAEKEKELVAKHCQPKPVRVFVTYEVLDFDGDKLAKPFVLPETK